jgi:hypothetical protein
LLGLTAGDTVLVLDVEEDASLRRSIGLCWFIIISALMASSNKFSIAFSEVDEVRGRNESELNRLLSKL